MKLYRIHNWNELYENNRSRNVTDLSWVKLPNRHDGEHFSAIMAHKDGAEIFAAFVLMVEVASKCDPRGILIKDNKIPHTPLSLSLKTRAPAKWFEKALVYLENNTDWLVVTQVAEDGQDADGQLTLGCQSVAALENGMEWNGMESIKRREEVKTILEYLNQKTGAKFRQIESNFIVIEARLKEPDVTVDGVKQMIDRQVKKWTGTKMEEYLRPTTLFRVSKFDTYYAARELPVKEYSEDKAPTHIQIQILESNIESHPANGASTCHDPNKTPAQMEELKQLRIKLRDLKEKAVQ